MTGPQLATRCMKARRESQCPACRKWIRPGNQIAKVHGMWLCIACAISHQHKTSTEGAQP